MAGVASITSLINGDSGPGFLRSPRSGGGFANSFFALTGNALGFGRGLLPNEGLLENRNDFEWEMGCLSWQRGGGRFFVTDPETGEVQVERGLFSNNTRERVEDVPPKAIKFRVNPSDVSWTLAQRSQEQKTKAGTVLHVWNDNQRKTYYDEPVLTINFQSGNILPRRSVLDFNGRIPEGLDNFYEFMALVDEVKVLDNGDPNLCYIQYNSLIFPSITLWGFWQPQGISFSDNSNTHAQVNNWTASFTVYKSTPEIGRAIATNNQSRVDGQEAGLPLKQRYLERVGFTYSNKRSETFAPLQQLAITSRAVISGQVPPGDIASAAKASVNAASRNVTASAVTAAVGAGAAIAAGAGGARAGASRAAF